MLVLVVDISPNDFGHQKLHKRLASTFKRCHQDQNYHPDPKNVANFKSPTSLSPNFQRNSVLYHMIWFISCSDCSRKIVNNQPKSYAGTPQSNIICNTICNTICATENKLNGKITVETFNLKVTLGLKWGQNAMKYLGVWISDSEIKFAIGHTPVNLWRIFIISIVQFEAT